MTRRRTPGEVESRGFVPFARTLGAFDKPLIAAVQGGAVGVGVTMLLHCDVVLALTTARFRTPFVSPGIVPEAGSSLLLPGRVGPVAAADMLLTGRWRRRGGSHLGTGVPPVHPERLPTKRCRSASPPISSGRRGAPRRDETPSHRRSL
jgi:hypothetical protein